MNTYNIITATDESTVVAEYNTDSARSDSYQGEADLERELRLFLRSMPELAETRF